MTLLEAQTFQNCTSLTNVTLPDGLVKIEDYVFYNTGITSITIPDSVTSLGISAFSNCASLEWSDESRQVAVPELLFFEGCDTG